MLSTNFVHSLIANDADKLSLTQALSPVLEQVGSYLIDFANSQDFTANMRSPFGDTFEEEVAVSLGNAWENADFSIIPAITVLSSAELNGANGAYAATKNTIYLSAELLSNNSVALVDVVLEELGHRIDTLLNQTDSVGDEGAIFSKLVQGKSLDDATLLALKTEDDSGVIIIDGEAIAVENAVTPSTGLNALLNETGKIYLSVDGNGTSSSTGTIQVLKNPGATVRAAYLVGDGVSNIATKAAVNGTDVAWSRIESTPVGDSETFFYSYVSDVTSLVKSTIDAAAPGTLNIAVDEGAESLFYEGLALAVIFDDPNQIEDQSIILYFGGLDPTGGTATINFPSPVDTSSNLEATLGLGIGYSSNSSSLAVQSSEVRVNDQLLTSVAGNYDDGERLNGALFTIGGLGDSPINPPPFSTDLRTDDELYNLLPFIQNGDTSLTLNTFNPSNDDHIFFTHVTLKGITGTDSTNVVELAVTPGNVNEDTNGDLTYTFSRTGSTTSPLTVSYIVSGTATFNTDYTQTGADSFTDTTGTVTFAADASTATVNIKPIADIVTEPNENVSLTLTTGIGYAIGTSISVIGTILDNDAPTNIVLSNSNIEENKAVGEIIGDLTTTDPDLENTFTYSLVTGTGSTDNNLFTISNNQLQTNAVFDYESQNTYNIRVQTTDQGGLFYEKQLVIGITNVNETPSNINLSQNSINENQAIGTVVGNLSTTDPDSGNTFTYSLVTGTGSTDNNLFTISNNQLQTNAVFDYESQNTYNIRVQIKENYSMKNNLLLALQTLMKI
jgi:hypothetical protein